MIIPEDGWVILADTRGIGFDLGAFVGLMGAQVVLLTSPIVGAGTMECKYHHCH